MTEIIIGLTAVISAIVAFALRGMMGNRKARKAGAQEAKQDAIQADQGRARGVRDRVRNADDRLRELDDAGYRD